MTIRRQITVSFIGILAILSGNLFLYLWMDAARNAAFEDLQRVMSRESLISAIQQKTGDYQKQITLLSQTIGSDLQSPSPAEMDEFNAGLAQVQQQARQLVMLTDAADRPGTEAFANTLSTLSESWRIFYENLGSNHQLAITELVVQGEGLERTVLQDMLPRLQKIEEDRQSAAATHF